MNITLKGLILTAFIIGASIFMGWLSRIITENILRKV